MVQKYDNDYDRMLAIRKSKTKYMLNKPWTCETCDYTSNLASKWMHLKTKRHIYNTIIKALQDDDRIELIIDE